MRFLLGLECAIYSCPWMGLRAEARTLSQMEKINRRRTGWRAGEKAGVLRCNAVSLRPQDIGIRLSFQRLYLRVKKLYTCKMPAGVRTASGSDRVTPDR